MAIAIQDVSYDAARGILEVTCKDTAPGAGLIHIRVADPRLGVPRVENATREDDGNTVPLTRSELQQVAAELAACASTGISADLLIELRGGAHVRMTSEMERAYLVSLAAEGINSAHA